MARFGRREQGPPDGGDNEEWPDQSANAGRRNTSSAAALPADELPSSRLRGNEITYGYAVGGIIAVASVIMLVVPPAKGASTQPLWPTLGIVLGLATVLSIRFHNRMLTSLVAIAGGFVSGQAKTPASVSGVKIVALLAPVLYGVMIFRRQSKADRALRARRPRQSAAERRGARSGGRGSARSGDEPEPGKPKPSGRYTPPKAKTPSPKASRAKR